MLFILTWSILILLLLDMLALLVTGPMVFRELGNRYEHPLGLYYPDTPLADRGSVIMLEGLGLQLYYAWLWVVISGCLFWMLYRHLPPLREQIMAGFRKKGSKPSDTIEEQGLLRTMSGLFALSALVSFAVFGAARLSGAEPEVLDLTKMQIWQALFLLANASVWEEVMFRLVLIGVPMTLLHLGRRRRSGQTEVSTLGDEAPGPEEDGPNGPLGREGSEGRIPEDRGSDGNGQHCQDRKWEGIQNPDGREPDPEEDGPLAREESEGRIPDGRGPDRRDSDGRASKGGKPPWYRYLFGGIKDWEPASVILVVFSATYFAYAHVGHGWDWFKFPGTFVSGLIFAYLFQRWGLHTAISMHFLFDYAGTFMLMYEAELFGDWVLLPMTIAALCVLTMVVSGMLAMFWLLPVYLRSLKEVLLSVFFNRVVRAP